MRPRRDILESDDILAKDSVPYVFSSFEVVGAFETIGAFASGERWRPAPPGAGGMRKGESPAANTVVLFPGNGRKARSD
jgi:hypothetical protein